MTVSLILPIYNEQANIQKGVLDKIGNYTHSRKKYIEVFLVDDGSTDGTAELIKNEYLPKFPKFRLVENPHQGKAYAVITGIKQAQGDYVLFSDADLATPIEESEKLISEITNGYQLVIGSRDINREGAPILRKIMARGFIVIRDLMIGLSGIRDTQCGFKLFDRSAAVRIIDHLNVFKNGKTVYGSSVSAGFDLEFLYVARIMGLRIKEVPVVWRHVETHNVNFIKDTLETLRDIALIKYYALKRMYHT